MNDIITNHFDTLLTGCVIAGILLLLVLILHNNANPPDDSL
jgi:hypothetical protein